MQSESLKAHVWFGAQLQVQTDRPAHLESILDIGLEVPASGAAAMGGKELEDVRTGALSVVVLCADREEHVDNAGGDEGDEEGAVIDYDKLGRVASATVQIIEGGMKENTDIGVRGVE